MRLAHPFMLMFLLVLPVLLLMLRRQQRPAAIAYSSTHDLAALPPSCIMRLQQALPLLRLLIVALGIIALARPQQGLRTTKVYSEGIAILMVVDISGSMRALDLHLNGVQRSRLDVVKHTFRQFVQGGKGLAGRDADLIGMVTFARYPDSISPLTLDHNTLLALLEPIEIVSLQEEDGTAIGEAITLAVERLRHATAQSKVMILLTDGSNNAGETDPQQAADIAKALGIKIYTIGAGTRGVAPVPVQTRNGRTVIRQMRVAIDERTLHTIAETTGGRYFRATDTATLQNIYAEINHLEKTTNIAEQYQEYAERFSWFLLPGLALLLLEIALTTTRLRTIP